MSQGLLKLLFYTDFGSSSEDEALKWRESLKISKFMIGALALCLSSAVFADSLKKDLEAGRTTISGQLDGKNIRLHREKEAGVYHHWGVVGGVKFHQTAQMEGGKYYFNGEIPPTAYRAYTMLRINPYPTSCLTYLFGLF